ncbi:hypothetical protein BTVI_100308 [Pitangus sulphuratus]|nr:hypothetical protein BTVI_100308 [Pitangus sulphuratus]
MLEERLLEKTGRALSDRYQERMKAMRCLFLLTCAISLACVEEACQASLSRGKQVYKSATSLFQLLLVYPPHFHALERGVRHSLTAQAVMDWPNFLRSAVKAIDINFKEPPPNPPEVLESRMKAGMTIAEGMWEAQADSGAGGTMGPDSLMVLILPLLFSSSLPLIPGLDSAHSKPKADCRLMEVLGALVLLFLGPGMDAGACWSPLMGLRTSGLLN